MERTASRRNAFNIGSTIAAPEQAAQYSKTRMKLHRLSEIDMPSKRIGCKGGRMSGTVTSKRLRLRVELDLARYLGAWLDCLHNMSLSYHPNTDTMVCDSCSQPVQDASGIPVYFSKEKFDRFSIDFVHTGVKSGRKRKS
jgi:hypothetical protein